MIIFSDEIYDKIIYDDAEHISIASLANDLLFVTFNGLSKTYRVAGFRSGWMIVSGAKRYAADFIEGLDILANMRLCANVPAQHAIQTALGGYQTINDLIRPGGRLLQQRDKAYEMICNTPGLSCVKPKGALYLFPKIDIRKIPIFDDEKFVLDLLLDKKILLVQGTAFNLPTTDHFRIVFLPHFDKLEAAIGKIGQFLESYHQ